MENLGHNYYIPFTARARHSWYSRRRAAHHRHHSYKGDKVGARSGDQFFHHETSGNVFDIATIGGKRGPLTYT